MAYMDDILERLPGIIESGLTQLEVMIDDPTVDAKDRIDAIEKIRKIAKEMTGSSMGRAADEVGAFIEFRPDYLNKMVDLVMQALDWVEWPVRDQALAKRIVGKWCGAQEKLAHSMMESGKTKAQADDERDDGFRWDWIYD